MKQDLDLLMEERGLAALVVSGKLNGNPPLFYMVNGAKIIRGQVFKKHGQEPVLVCAPIDREEAAASGLKVLTTNDFDYEGILRETPDQLEASLELYRRVFARLDIQGRAGFYGMEDQGSAWKLLQALQSRVDGIEVFGETGKTLLDLARATKDAAEAGRIREVGRRTALVMDQTVAFLQSHRVKNEILVQPDGSPLTIGRVHQEINRFLAGQGLDVPEGIIFSSGRDAGVPHNKGTASEPVALGKAIIYDFGTREAGGGYYFDMTRTFCLGYAPPEVEQAYRDVLACQELILGAYQVGTSVRTYQSMAFDHFESRGHPTTRSSPNTESGFVHGLGHGIGLAVHEEPFFTDKPSNTSILQPGHIFTLEPGVYYPERGFGVRLEDVIWIDPEGGIQNLTDYPKELVVPM